MVMLNLFEPLGSPANRPSTEAAAERPRAPEKLGRSVPKPSPTASMSSLLDVPGNRRNSEVMSRPFVEIRLI